MPFADLVYLFHRITQKFWKKSDNPFNPIIGGRCKVQFAARGFRPPPPSYLKKTTLFSDKRLTELDRPWRDLKLLQRSFSGQVNIEVTRAHQRLNFQKMVIFSQAMAINSKSTRARKDSKKALDSSLHAPSAFFDQIWPKVNRFDLLEESVSRNFQARCKNV